MNGYSTSRTQVFRRIFIELTRKEFSLRYRASILGFAWSLLNPLLYAAVLSTAFTAVIKHQQQNYGLFILVAMFSWQAFSNITTGSCGIFLSNRDLIRRTKFPRWLLVSSAVSCEMIHQLLALPVLYIFILTAGVPLASPLDFLLFYPALILVQCALLMSIGLLMATANLFLRDLERITTLGVGFLFFLSGIIAPLSESPWQWLNPAAMLVDSYRSLFYQGNPNWISLGCCVLGTLVVALVAIIFYARREKYMAEIV
jgi:lipopolysaccharide transport system permease protein